MALKDIQRRGQQIGRIRIGQQVPTENGKMRPAKLDTFRFTTQSRHTADAIAELFGGTVQDWNGQFEVITDRNAIGVTVPPRDQVVSQWYEMWSKGGATRRCDSQIEKLSGKPCLCPHAEDPSDPVQVEAAAQERARLAALKTPQACKPVTRISLMIPDLPGLGVFRIDTSSYYAAVEIGDAAELLQIARDRGTMLPAVLRIEQRTRIADGKTKRYPVPVLEILASFREIASGALEAGGIAAQLPPAPAEQRRALTAGAPAPQAPVEPPRPKDAQAVADLALKATTADEVDAHARYANEQGWNEDIVQVAEDVFEELRPFLYGRWQALQQPEGDAA